VSLVNRCMEIVSIVYLDKQKEKSIYSTISIVPLVKLIPYGSTQRKAKLQSFRREGKRLF
jgi:hypothetical protein